MNIRITKRLAAADYDRIARQAASDLGPAAPSPPVRREPHGRTLPKGKGRGRWLALDTMDHIIGSLQRSQQKMSKGGVQDGAHLVRMAFDVF